MCDLEVYRFGCKNLQGNQGLHGSNLFRIVPETVYLFRISLRDCRWALFFASPIHEHGFIELDLCTVSCPMCSFRVCKISWNDSGAVYLGMDKIRNPDAEKTGVPVRKSLF